MKDDTSVFVIDMTHSKEMDFPDIVASLASSVPVSGGGALLSCFGPKEMDVPKSCDLSGPGHLTLLSDIDSLEVSL